MRTYITCPLARILCVPPFQRVWLRAWCTNCLIYDRQKIPGIYSSQNNDNTHLIGGGGGLGISFVHVYGVSETTI